MRKLILLLFLSTFCSFSQTLKIDHSLEPYVIEFIIEAQSRDLQVIDRIMELDSISIYPIVGGSAVYTEKVIMIHPLTMENQYKIRATLYHELFHHLGLSHCHNSCTHLMGANYPFNFNYFIYVDDELWQEVINIEFKKL